MLGVRRLRRPGDDRIFCCAVAAVLVFNEVISWFLLATREGLMVLPLHPCDLAIFLVAWALLARNRFVGEVAFFWGLGGSTQALLTPDLAQGFPSYNWTRFFLSHSGVALSAVYLLARGRLELTSGSVWRVWLASNVYLFFIGIFNWIFGTNFAYLAAKPERPSLLDHLGPWPYYILWGSLIGLAVFFLCYAFARLVDRRAGRDSPL